MLPFAICLNRSGMSRPAITNWASGNFFSTLFQTVFISQSTASMFGIQSMDAKWNRLLGFDTSAMNWYWSRSIPVRQVTIGLPGTMEAMFFLSSSVMVTIASVFLNAFISYVLKRLF